MSKPREIWPDLMEENSNTGGFWWNFLPLEGEEDSIACCRRGHRTRGEMVEQGRRGTFYADLQFPSGKERLVKAVSSSHSPAFPE